MGLLAKGDSPVAIEPGLVLIVAACYGALYFCMGSVWLPPDSAAFAVFLLWASALVMAELLSRTLRLPRVVGMVLSGMMWGNLPSTPTAAMPPAWGALIRAAGLATAFLRCGLELDAKLLHRFMLPTVTLLLAPGLAETFYTAGIGTAVFRGMPILLAISMGFILNAAGPGLVVPSMLHMQAKGYGTRAGVPFLPAMAASFDDFVAITGYSIFIHLAIVGQGHTGWDIAIGPVQVFIGIFFGCVAGLVLACTRMFKTLLYRVAGLISFSLFIMYMLNHFSMLSGGGLASLTLAFLASHLWERGLPRWLSSGPCCAHTALASQAVALFWSWITEPLLFGTVMADVLFKTMPTSVISGALIVIFTGMAVRFGVVLATMSGYQYTWRHVLFLAVAWIPKATVQAALCGAPLALIRSLKADSPDYHQWLVWGQAIQVTGSLTIVICGTLGTALTYKLGPILLEHDGPEGKAELEGEVDAAAAATKAAADLEAPGGGKEQLQKQQKQGQQLEYGPDRHGSVAAAGPTGQRPPSLFESLSVEAPTALSLQQYYAAVEELLEQLRHSEQQQKQHPSPPQQQQQQREGAAADGSPGLQLAQGRLEELHRQLGLARPTVRQWLAGVADRYTSTR